MHVPAIKICGLRTVDTLASALRAGCDHVGFNFFARSPRYIDPEQAEGLRAMLPAHVSAVAITVDPDDALLERLKGVVDAIQLHGHESPERAAAIKRMFGLRVWKAIPVKTAADIDASRAYADAADFLLYDAKTPDGADMPGGMGLRFDWRLLSGFSSPLPWGLSGGLDPFNVARAVAVTGAPLVDVSSGVESAPGVKDVDKIAAFCEAARRS